MLVNKFDYKPLHRIATDAGRKYITPDNQALASVTTILDATKPQESKQALKEWRKRVGEKKAQEITSAAASRGTRMHSYLENYIIEDSLREPGKHPMSIQSHNMAAKIIEHGLSKCDEYWGVEVSLYFPKIYAGTTDLVGVWQGRPSIIDFKQTNKEKKTEWIEDYFLQLAFYGTAHNELYDTDIKTGVIMMCTVDCKYQEFSIEGNQWNTYVDKMWRRLEQYYTLLVK